MKSTPSRRPPLNGPGLARELTSPLLCPLDKLGVLALTWAALFSLAAVGLAVALG